MSIRRVMPGVLAALLLLVTAPAGAQEYKVIVNSANAATELPASVVSKLFLKQAAAFPDGTPAAPVDLPKASAIRAAFAKGVLGRPVSAVETYWQQQIFSGKEVPPPTRASDDDVVTFVKSTPGGIGYVSRGAAVSGVKVLEIK